MSYDRLRQTRCFLLDMDGTFYLGERILPGALDFIHTIEKRGQDYIFLTNNSSKSSRQYAAKLRRLGLEVAEDKVFTSGEATALYLKQQGKTRHLSLVGTPELEAEFVRHGFNLAHDNPDAVVLGFDTTITYEKLWRLCNHVRSGTAYIATHPDLNCPTPEGSMPDIGATIAFVKASTGRDPDLVVGKPNRLIVDMLRRKLDLPAERLTMIGDRLHTDIALGGTSGVTTALVLSGEAQREDLAGSAYQPDYVFDDLGAAARAIESRS